MQHSGRIATLDGDYGYPLAYHGLIGTRQLALSIDRSLAILSGQQLSSTLAQLQATDAEYFVGTVFAEVAAQPDLQQWLITDARLLEQAGGASWWRYAVWELASQ